MRRLALLSTIVCLAFSVLLTGTISAQGTKKTGSAATMSTLCVSGCGGGSYSVSVTPKSHVALPSQPATGPWSTVFHVSNTGTYGDTYSLACSGDSYVVCDSLVVASGGGQLHIDWLRHLCPTCGGGAGTTGSVTLAAGTAASVTLWWHTTLTAGTGTLTLSATGTSADQGYQSIAVGNPVPSVSLIPYNAGDHDQSKCLAACFNYLFTYAAPAYYSMGRPHSPALIYNSSTVRPIPVLTADVSAPNAQYYLTTYSVRAQLVSNSSYLTLLNGATIVYYQAPMGQTVRLAAAIDARANGLATGWYDVNLIVVANYSTGGNQTATVRTRLLVVDQTGSMFGPGFNLAGLQRLYTEAGSSSAMIVEGDGSAAFYSSSCDTCSFATPGGASASLVRATVNGASGYKRIYLDSSYVSFGSDGRMTQAVDRFGNKVTYNVFSGDTTLDEVADPANRKVTFTYSATSPNHLLSITTPLGTSQLSYNSLNQMSQIKDPDSLTTQLSYGSNNAVTGITDRAGHLWTIGYDTLARLRSVQAPQVTLYTGGNATPTSRYYSPDDVVWEPGTAGTTSGSAKPAVRSDTVFAWVVGADSLKAKFTLDRFGAPIATTGPTGLVESTPRDTMGRVTSATSPRGHHVYYTYAGYLLTRQQDTYTGQDLKYYYNARNDIDSITGGAMSPELFLYHDGTQGPKGAFKAAVNYWQNDAPLSPVHWPNAQGLDTLVTTRLEDTSTVLRRISYGTGFDNPITMTDGGGNTTTTQYNAAGLPDTVTDPMGGKWSVAYDAMGRVKARRTALGLVTAFTYTPLGMVQRIVDPKNQTYKWSFDALGRLVAQFSLADSTKADSTFYDLTGHARKVRRRDGRLITASYDSLGRVTARTIAGAPADTFRYASNGAWMVAKDSAGYDSVAYDLAGRASFVLQTFGTVAFSTAYQYDTVSRLTGRTTTGPHDTLTSVVTWVNYHGGSNYGTISRQCHLGLCAETDPSAYTEYPTDYTFNPGPSDNCPCIGDTNYIWGENVPQPVYQAETEQGVSGGARLTSQQFEVPYWGTELSGLDSAYATSLTTDFRGLPYWGTGALLGTAGARTGFQYDADRRLTNVCSTTAPATCTNEYGGTGSAYSYDAAGNRIDSAAAAIIGAGNHYVQFNGYTLSYDANGDLAIRKKAGDSTAYAWDAAGRLLSVSKNGVVTAKFSYDPLGRRVRRVTASGTLNFFYDGDKLIADVDSTGHAVQEYAYYEGSGRLFAVKNTLWSGVAIDNGLNHSTIGIVDYYTPNHRIKAYAYSPWGATAADTGRIVRQRYAGAEYDQETGLYWMGTRYYDPALGSFLSEDPAGTAGGLNLYQYAAANPVSLFDPSGTGPTDGMSRCDPEDNGTVPSEQCIEDQAGNDGIPSAQCPDTPGPCHWAQPQDYEQYAEEAEFLNNAALDDAYAYQMVAEPGSAGTSNDPPTQATRTIGQCFAQNTAPVTGAFGHVLGGVAAGLSAGLVGLGRLVTASGAAQKAAGTVDIDLFRAVSTAAGTLIEDGIASEVAGSAAIAQGATVTAVGVYTAVGTLGLAVSYFAASALICAADPSY